MKNKIAGYYIEGDHVKFTDEKNKAIKKVPIRSIVDRYLKDLKNGKDY